jgi:hypothetical protein
MMNRTPGLLTTAQALLTGVPEESAATAAAIDRFSSDEACDASGGQLLYVGLNSWIPAEPKLVPCRENAP